MTNQPVRPLAHWTDVRRHRRTMTALALVASVVTACASRPAPGPSIERGGVQRGTASWYGPGFHGKPTASGAIYDQDGMSAAHRTIALGSRIRVTHLGNGRTVEVVVNDRGPFKGRRILDLSRGAARALDMEQAGLAEVEIRLVAGPGYRFAVQLGAFRDRDRALDLQLRLGGRFGTVRIEHEDGWHRVRLGRFADRAEAESLRRQLRREGFDGRVLRLP